MEQPHREGTALSPLWNSVPRPRADLPALQAVSEQRVMVVDDRELVRPGRALLLDLHARVRKLDDLLAARQTMWSWWRWPITCS